jgi:hypothetical protein
MRREKVRCFNNPVKAERSGDGKKESCRGGSVAGELHFPIDRFRHQDFRKRRAKTRFQRSNIAINVTHHAGVVHHPAAAWRRLARE